MASRAQNEGPSRRDFYEGTISGALDRPFIPRLRNDPKPSGRLAPSLEAFRREEGRDLRKRRLQALWKKIPHNGNSTGRDVSNSALASISVTDLDALDLERAEKLAKMYEDELMRGCMEAAGDEGSSSAVTWKEFKEYAFAKEEGVFGY